MWETTLLSRLGWGFKLFGRTIVVQSVAGLIAVALILLAILLGSLSPAAAVFASTFLSIAMTLWLYQVFVASFARSLEQGGMPPLVACLKDGLSRLPVIGNAMFLLIVAALPAMVVVALLGAIHPLLSLLGILVLMWIALRLFTLAAVVAMENIGPWGAFKRAWRLSDGFLLKMLGNLLFVLLVFLLLGIALTLLSSLLGITAMLQPLFMGIDPAIPPDPAMLLMALDPSALIAIGGFLLVAFLAELLTLVLMMAYCFFFYTEQHMSHDDGKPKWQPAGMADRKQWLIYISVVAVLSLVPSVAVALNPDRQTMVAAPVQPAQQQKATVKPAPAAVSVPVTQASKAGKPADNPPALPAVAEQAGPAAGDEQVPDSESHRIKAPEIDIEALRDPFESYLTVLERKSQIRKQAHREQLRDREPQPLENYDLAALRLVATMKMGAERAAMVEDPEGKGYVVRKGSYIGRDNGKVVSISERTVEIIENEFTAAGDVVKRKATLTLNEVNQ